MSTQIPLGGVNIMTVCDLLLTLKTWFVWATSIQHFPRSFFTHLSCRHSFSKHHPTQVSIQTFDSTMHILGLSNSWFDKNLQFQFTQISRFYENYGSDSNYFLNLMKPQTILSRVFQIPTPLVLVLVPTRASHKVRFKRLILESGYLELDSELAHN